MQELAPLAQSLLELEFQYWLDDLPEVPPMQELALLAQAQLQVGTFQLRVPRLRCELRQAMVLQVSQGTPRLRFVCVLVADEWGAQPRHISMLSTMPGTVRAYTDESDGCRPP